MAAKYGGSSRLKLELMLVFSEIWSLPRLCICSVICNKTLLLLKIDITIFHLRQGDFAWNATMN